MSDLPQPDRGHQGIAQALSALSIRKLRPFLQVVLNRFRTATIAQATVLAPVEFTEVAEVTLPLAVPVDALVRKSVRCVYDLEGKAGG